MCCDGELVTCDLIDCFPHLLTVDAEINVCSVENPELTNVLPLKPGGGQNIAMHALHTARNFLFVLI